jgi:hypothetical protein
MPIAVIAPLNDTVQPLATEQSLTFYTQLLSEGVLWGLSTTAQGVPDLTVNVSAGFGILNTNNDLKKYPFASAGGILSFGAAPSAGNSRIDLVVVTITVINGNLTTATIDVIAGTPATTGTQVAPILVETSALYYLVLARVTITGASSAITSGQIVTTGTITNASNVNLKPITGATIFEVRAVSVIENSYIEDGRFVKTAGDTMTGKLQFSGTTHAGVRLNNLTTAQRDALTAQLGDQIFNTDAGVVETRTAIGWVGGLAQKQINATKIFVEQNFL